MALATAGSSSVPTENTAVTMTSSSAAADTIRLSSAPTSVAVGGSALVQVTFGATADDSILMIQLKRSDTNELISEGFGYVNTGTGAMGIAVAIPANTPTGNPHYWTATVFSPGWQPLAYEDGPAVTLTPAATGAGLYYVHTDHLGTPQAVTDQNQLLVWRARYSPFGNAILETAAITNPLRFPGQYYDQETGLHYNYFRTYDPSAGRYLESDPIGLRGGLNTYIYVKANPLKFTDPRGLDNVGCTTEPITIDGRCKRICCAIHDKCYDENNCTADSWTDDKDCDAEACDKCNKDLVKCFVWCDQAEPMGIKPAPGTPEYYCPAQHRYIAIPGDFPTAEAAKAACGN